MKLVDTVRELASAKGVKPAQVALAWLLAQGTDIVPIPGTKRRRYLEENAAAVEVKLSPAELQALAAAAPRGETAGPRYGERMMGLLDR
jgi:aryl-alcohol dehydrogenase-like predicted oxidoreductase